MSLVDNRRGKLAAYAPWLARDYLTNQGPATIIVVLLVALLVLKTYHAATGKAMSEFDDVDARRMLRNLVGLTAFLGTFFATNGIVSNDRKHNTYKFLFAKPVSPPSYYATTFLVHGAGLMIVTLALAGLWSALTRSMFPLDLFLVVAIVFVAYGGIGFLLSAAWRFDWLSLITVLFVANTAWGIWGEGTGPLRYLLYLLPPVHRMDGVSTLIMRMSHEAVPWKSILWLVGYGLVCFGLGLVVIRRRPLGTS